MPLESVLEPGVRKGPGSPAVGLHPQALGEPPLCLVCFWTFFFFFYVSGLFIWPTGLSALCAPNPHCLRRKFSVCFGALEAESSALFYLGLSWVFVATQAFL